VLRAIHTPGHRPEHTCIAVIDRSRADEPWLVLTGDSLFVGDAPGPTSRSARRKAPRSSFTRCGRLLELPDGVEVFPGHVAGSLCGKAMSSKGSSTIGFERRFNSAAPDRARGRLRRRLGLGVGAQAAEHDPARGAELRASRRRRPDVVELPVAPRVQRCSTSAPHARSRRPRSRAL
jgi:glyoxylase-like metal-dependent hydrolase (beta-lactamase superfamily II)